MALVAVEKAKLPKVPTPIDGRAEVVAAIRRLLAEAEAGEIAMLGWAVLRPLARVQTGWTRGRRGNNFAMVGALHQTAWELQRDIGEAGDEEPPTLPEPPAS